MGVQLPDRPDTLTDRILARAAWRGLFILIAAATSGGPALAQDTETPSPAGFGVGLAASYLTFGDEFEGLSGGFGGEFSVRYTWYGGFQLLAGVHYSVHDIDRLPGNVKFMELFVDPRYVIQLFESQRVVLLIAGRLAYASERTAGTIDATANGFMDWWAACTRSGARWPSK